MFFNRSQSVFVAIAVAVSLVLSPALQAAQTRVVPSGTMIRLILNDDLTTRSTDQGDRFKATVAERVSVGGRVLVPQGAIVEGTVTEVEKAKRGGGVAGRAKLVLRFDRLRASGQSYPLRATLVSVHDPVPGLDSKDVQDVDIDEEGEVDAETDMEGIITRGAIGVAAGALLGALFGNVSRGLLIGSIGGAIAILAPKGKHVELKEGTGLQIRLDRDLNMSIT
jgi:hypothetical protein